MTRQPLPAQETFYIWARPDAGKTLQNWSLKLVSSDTSVITFNSSSVDSFNNAGGTFVRWEDVGEPLGAGISTTGLSGVNIGPGSGLGIGPATTGTDTRYNAANNAWLLASINFNILKVGQASIFLRIGDIGMNHSLNGTEESSSMTSAVFGHATETALNANSQRNMSSANADLFISISNTPDPTADFDNDSDVDGRDFLAWQRGFGTASGASLQQGDANHDGAVNAADLSIWQTQYGQPGHLTVQATAVPEPTTALLLLFSLAAVNRRGYRAAA